MVPRCASDWRALLDSSLVRVEAQLDGCNDSLGSRRAYCYWITATGRMVRACDSSRVSKTLVVNVQSSYPVLLS